MSSIQAHSQRIIGLLLALVLLLVAVSGGVSAAKTPTLVDVRAAHHTGFDRIVFEFDGPVPDVTKVRWASDLRLDPSDKPAHVHGNAFLRVRFYPALAHDPEPPQDSTFGPQRRAYALPNIAHVVLLGDVEADVSLGIGLMKKTRILRATTLRRPSRFVVDVATGFKKRWTQVFFVDQEAVRVGQLPEVVPVVRKVPVGGRAKGALHRLFAGPTASELARGLRFQPSGTTGFRNFWINDRRIARVTLKGPCDAGGSALPSVASLIMPTLRQLPKVDWVKIYDREGTTLWPWGRSDSVPGCLQP
jgi:hypothetical protein